MRKGKALFASFPVYYISPRAKSQPFSPSAAEFLAACRRPSSHLSVFRPFLLPGKRRPRLARGAEPFVRPRVFAGEVPPSFSLFPFVSFKEVSPNCPRSVPGKSGKNAIILLWRIVDNFEKNLSERLFGGFEKGKISLFLSFCRRLSTRIKVIHTSKPHFCENFITTSEKLSTILPEKPLKTRFLTRDF